MNAGSGKPVEMGHRHFTMASSGITAGSEKRTSFRVRLFVVRFLRECSFATTATTRRAATRGICLSEHLGIILTTSLPKGGPTWNAGKTATMLRSQNRTFVKSESDIR